ncbi:hypothetical protein EG329_007981 [Mollisiaceae sp. DMI_Dod_QoI]|nr:hypothetical protein EG329_007981 [Helotiales sp. DMI_Dod_QoI]
MSFGFGVGDFIAVGKLTFDLWRSMKGAPGDFDEISRELGSFYIVLHGLQDQLQDKVSLLNRRGLDRKQELQTLVSNLDGTLQELQALFIKYEQMGRGAWLRFQFGQERVSELRGKMTLHIILINQFTDSLILASTGRMEPKVNEILIIVKAILKGMARDTAKSAHSIVSAHKSDNAEHWAPIELELHTEGISPAFTSQNREKIKMILDEVLVEEGYRSGEDVEPDDSVSQNRATSSILSTPLSESQVLPIRPSIRRKPVQRNVLGDAAANEEEAIYILLTNQGFRVEMIPKLPTPKPERNLIFRLRSRSERAKRFKEEERGGEVVNERHQKLAVATRALCWAAAQGNQAAVSFILGRGAVPSEGLPPPSPLQGKPALLFSLEHQHESISRTLLEAGATVHCSGPSAKDPQYGHGLSAMHYAAMYGSTSMIIALLEGGAHIDDYGGDVYNSWRSGGYLTPLHVAIIKGRTEAVQTLLDHGADSSRWIDIGAGGLGPYSGYPAIHLAARFGAVDIVNLLLDRLVSVDQPTLTLQSNLEGMKRYYQPFRGPLHVAAMYDQDEVVKLLLNRGAQINKSDGYGLNALAYAEFP